MSSLWEDVKNAIVEGYVYAADKADELTQIGKTRVDILRVNRKIARVMSEIGGRVYEFFERGEQAAIPEDEGIQRSVESIAKLRVELEQLEKEIEKIKAERVGKTSEQ